MITSNDLNKGLENPQKKISDPSTTKTKLIKTEDLYKGIDPQNFSFGEQQFVGQAGIGKSEFDRDVTSTEIQTLGLDYIRASQQSGAEQAGRAIGGGLYKGVLTAVEDVGYLLDVENNFNRLTGLEEIDTNWLSDWAKQAKESYDENHPIYRYNPSKVMDWSDPGFYWSAIQGIVDSAVGFGLVGAGAGATVGRGLKALSAFGKAGIPIQNMIATAGTALTTNYAEGKMMALEMFTNTVNEGMREFDQEQFNKAINQVRTFNPMLDPVQITKAAQKLINSPEYQAERAIAEKDIRSVAGTQADTFQKRNMIFMASDALAINGMFRGVGSTRNLLKDKSLKNTAMMIAKQAPTEYAEEVGQGIFQKEGEYQAMKEAGMDVGKISSDPIARAWEFFADPQTQLEGLMGLFGGPVQHTLVQAPTNMLSRGSDQEYRDAQTEQIKENEQLLNALVADRAKTEAAKQVAARTGNEEAFNMIVDDEFHNVAYHNFQRGTTENLENHLKEIAELSSEEAAERGFTETYAEDAQTRLNDLKEAEKTYLKIYNKFSGEKDYMIHRRLYDLETKRNFITKTMPDLKATKQDLLRTIEQEVKALEDTEVSADQMKVKDLSLQIKTLKETKAKLTALKNEALLRPNKRLERVVQELQQKRKALEIANKHKYKYSQEELIRMNNEVVTLQEQFNRLSRFANEKTKNKQTITRVDNLYNQQITEVDKDLQRKIKERDKTKETLKANNEKVNAFNENDYSKWDDIVETQEKIDNFSNVKKLYDKEYNNLIANKDQYIKETEDFIKETETASKQSDVDNEPTPEGKKDIIEKEQDPEVKEKLKRDNDKNIQEEEKKQRIIITKNKVVPTEAEQEEVKTDEKVKGVTTDFIIDDDTIEDVRQEVDNTQDHINKLNSEIISSDNTGTEYTYKRTEKGFDLLAFLSRTYKKVVDGDKVSKEDIDNELNKESFVELLDPNRYGKGTDITLEVAQDDSIIIDNEGTTWGEYKEDNNITDTTSDTYIDTVPIIVRDTGGNVIGYLHQDSWISEENIYGNVQTAKKSLQKIRKKVIEDGRYKTKIKSKSIGYFFRNIDGPQKVVDVIEDPNIVLAVGGRDELFANKKLDVLNITNKDRIIPGYTYMVVQVGTDNTGKLYTAVPLLNTRIGDSDKNTAIKDSIINAIKIYYRLGRKEELTADEKMVYINLGKAGYDLGTGNGLTQYLNQFLHVSFTRGQSMKDYVKRYKTPSTKTLLSVDKQQIQFSYRNFRTGFINPLNTSPEEFAKAIRIISTQVVPYMYANVDKQTVSSKDKPLKGIVTGEGKMAVEDLYDTYTDYIKDNTSTDILAKKIDNTTYTYTIQPKVEMDFDEIIGVKEPLLEADRANEMFGFSEKFEETNQQLEEEGYEPLEGEDSFGDIDLSTFPDIDVPGFLPAVDEETVEKFREMSEKIILPNLTSATQSAVVDILFKDALNEIISNPDKRINVLDIYEETFKEIASNLIVRNGHLKILEKNLAKAKELNRVEDVEKFGKQIRQISSRVRLYQDYLLNKEELIRLTNNELMADNLISSVGTNEDGTIEDGEENNQNEKIYDKSSYESDKSDKMSRVVKRFLSGVRAYNADGTLQTNLLNRQKWMNYEEVYKQLQVVTANKSVDYDTIIQAIEEMQDIFPFFKDVIEKLGNDNYPEITSIRNQLTVLLTNHYANSKFTMFRENKDGSYTLTVNNSNSNSIDASIRDGWDSLFNQSSLVEVRQDGNLIVSIAEADKLLEQYNKWRKDIPSEAISEVKQWLKQFGIILDNKTWTDLEEGNFKRNRKKFSWQDQFKSGIFNILATQYLRDAKGKDALDNLPTKDGIVQDLSRLEGKYTLNFHSNSQREGVKTVYSYNTNKLVTDTTRDFKLLNESKDADGNIVYTSTLATDKYNVIFNSTSSWLNDMLVLDTDGNPVKADNGEYIVDRDSAFFNNIEFFTMSLEALKKQGQSSRDNRELNKLSAGEIELTKIGLLAAQTKDKSGNKKRIINLLYPTTSDKTTVMGLTVPAADVTFDFETGDITQETIDLIYNQLVQPEIDRMELIYNLEKEGKKINLEENYTNGGKQFLFLPALNDIEGLFNVDGTLNSDVGSYRSQINKIISQYVEQLVDEKLTIWENSGIIKNSKENIYIDKNFHDSFKVIADNRLKAVAGDMVVQYLIGNANTFQTYIGDPALFYKKNNRETFINVGKRLAGDIAPGEQGQGTKDGIYRQAFVKDRFVQSKVYKALEKILGEKAEAYKAIDSTDAQEYTTLLEDLYVKNMHGKIKMEGLYKKVHDIVTREIVDKENYNYLPQLKADLTKKEFDYFRDLVLQPTKPVYVKNITDKELGIERRLYIKSSSFALSPLLTEGTELEKLRIAMEKGGIARLAYDSAVKVGNVAEPAELWDENGNMLEDVTFDDTNTMVIPRAGFRIQQEVPYDPLKEAINKVSQASKNLFINMMEVEGFSVPWYKKGKKVKGKELNAEYIKLYKELFELQEKELFEELEYDSKNNTLNVEKLRDILKEEAIKRNYPIADLQSFDLDNELQFLAFSPSGQKFEALLNSIVTNRVIKMKFPGKSYVLGSEEGFRTKAVEDLNLGEMSITFTKNWTGELQAADGSGRPDQVIMPWDFKVDIENYKDEDGLLDVNKVPEKLLQRFGMRIPNQGPNSQAKIEVVGFLTKEQGDLLIAPREFVTRMGSDFDVDKLYIYKYDYLITDDRIEYLDASKYDLDTLDEKIQESKNEMVELLSSRKELRETIKDKQSWVNAVYEALNKKEWGEISEINTLRDELGELEDYIKYHITRMENLKKLKQGKSTVFNKILDVHLAIHSNPDTRVQRQIHQPLDFWKLDTIATEIDNAIQGREDADKLFTGLSDEYQKQKFINAAAGKALVGVFSNDSMFNALIQDKDLQFRKTTVTIGSNKSTGDLSSPYTLSTQKKLLKAIQETKEDKYPNIDEVNPFNYLDAEDIVYKSEVISGYQSAAVDNEKEQLLDKLNANSETAPVVKLMMMLGFAEEIPYFMTQDIIRDYVKEVKKLRGLGDFVADVEQVAYENIVNREEYKTDYDPKKHAKYGASILTISKMRAMIKGEAVDNYKLTQNAILDKYLTLKIKGRVLGKLQSSISLDSQGLGKSFFETLVRAEEIRELDVNIKNFDAIVKGNTIPAMAIQHGLENNNKLWERFLPYNMPAFVKTFDYLEAVYNKSDAGREARATFRSKMWNEIKKYRFSDPNLFTRELVENAEFVDNERKRLFINTSNNIAIAKIIQDIKKRFPDNRFLQTLEVSIKKNGQPSIIKFRASTKEWANEGKIYEGFIDLMLNEKNLGENNSEYKAQGKDNYTSRDLFQDLVWAAYLNGGIQEAWQYVKYIPASYLHLIPFADELNNWIVGINDNNNFKLINTDDGMLPSIAVKQIIQNNPEQLPKISPELMGDKLILSKGDKESPDYASQYDPDLPKGSKKFRLYEKIGMVKDSKGKWVPEYQEIPVLGTSGRDKVSEYNYLLGTYGTSVFGSTQEQKEEIIFKEGPIPTSGPINAPTMKPPLKKAELVARDLGLEDTYKPGIKISGNEVMRNTLSKISNNSKDAFHRKIAKVLLDNFDNLTLGTLRIKLTSSLKTSTGANAAGEYDPNTRRLSINTGIASHENETQMEYTILHEFIHALSMHTLANPNTDQKKVKSKLEVLRKELKNYFETSDEFKSEYEKYIKSNLKITNSDQEAFYGTIDIREFIAVMFSSERMQELANRVEVKNMSILEKFIDSIIELLNTMGLNITKNSVTEASMESIINLITDKSAEKEIQIEEKTDPNKTFGLQEDIDDKESFLRDLHGEGFLPEFIPSSRQVMREFNELNPDGTPKKLRVTDDNAKVMLKRVQKINQGQPYYKATYGETMGEEVSKSGRRYYRVYLTAREELKDPDYVADLVPKNILEDVMKQCK